MKKHGSAGDTIKTVISGFIFVLIIGLALYLMSISVAPDPDLSAEAFWAEMFKRTMLTVLLVASGVDFMYNMTKKILISIGGKNYNDKTSEHTQAYRYIEAKIEISDTKKLIDKHGLIMELEETVDYINYERRADVFESIIDDKIYKHNKQLQKRKNRKKTGKMTELRKELLDIKEDKLLVSNFKSSISRYDRENCIKYDTALAYKYDEPDYDIVYSKEVYNMRPINRTFIDKFFNNGIWLFFMERVKPIITPVMFAILTTYYIIEFLGSPQSTALLIAVGVSTIMAMLTGVITEISTRFERLYTRPYEDNNYILKKFRSRNKELIDVLEDGKMSIDELHEMQKLKFEALKKQLEDVIPVKDIIIPILETENKQIDTIIRRGNREVK